MGRSISTAPAKTKLNQIFDNRLFQTSASDTAYPSRMANCQNYDGPVNGLNYASYSSPVGNYPGYPFQFCSSLKQRCGGFGAIVPAVSEKYFGVWQYMNDGTNYLNRYMVRSADDASVSALLTSSEVLQNGSHIIYGDRIFSLDNSGNFRIYDIAEKTTTSYTTPGVASSFLPGLMYQYVIRDKIWFVESKSATKDYRVSSFNLLTNTFAVESAVYTAGVSIESRWAIWIHPTLEKYMVAGYNSSTSNCYRLTLTPTTATYNTYGTYFSGTWGGNDDTQPIGILRDSGMYSMMYNSSTSVVIFSTEVAPALVNLGDFSNNYGNAERFSTMHNSIIGNNYEYKISGTSGFTYTKTGIRYSVNRIVNYNDDYFFPIAGYTPNSPNPYITMFYYGFVGSQNAASFSNSGTLASTTAPYATVFTRSETAFEKSDQGFISRNGIMLYGFLRYRSVLRLATAAVIRINLPVFKLPAGSYKITAIGGGAGRGAASPINGTSSSVYNLITAGNGNTTSTTTSVGGNPGSKVITYGSTADTGGKGLGGSEYGSGQNANNADNATCGGASGYIASTFVTLSEPKTFIYTAGFGHQEGGHGCIKVEEL